MSNLRFLRTFAAVARYGSFAAAADRMALTQAAVSMQMRALEADLKHDLFDRSGRVVLLNAMGKALLPDAERLLSLYDAMRMSASQPEEAAGSIAVGAVESAIGALAHALAHLKSSRPRLEVRMMAAKSGDLAAQVESGEIDAAVVVESRAKRPASLTWTPLYTEPLVLLAGAGLPIAPPRELLGTQRFLRFDRTQRTGLLVDRTLRQLRVKVDDFLELNSLQGIAELVRQGVGVAVVPQLRRSSWARDELLRILPLPHAPARSIGLLERSRHDRTTTTAAVVQQLKQVI